MISKHPSQLVCDDITMAQDPCCRVGLDVILLVGRTPQTKLGNSTAVELSLEQLLSCAPLRVSRPIMRAIMYLRSRS